MAKNKGVIGATVAGLMGQVARRRRTVKSAVSLDAKRCLVTGANSGLGRAVATQLASLGATVTMAVRTTDDGARDAIASESGNSAVAVSYIDLAQLQTVRDFVAKMAAQGERFDVVVLNAAVVAKEARGTTDGLDEMTQVNYLANVLLVELLFRSGCMAANDEGGYPRVVVVNSEAHRWTEHIDVAQVGQLHPFNLKAALGHYSDTKFMMASYCSLLADRFARSQNGTVFALCPGAIDSNLAREAPVLLQPLLKPIFYLFFASPRKAAGPVLRLCTDGTLAHKNGAYFHRWVEKALDQRACEPAFRDRLYHHACGLLGIPPGEQRDDSAGEKTGGA